MTKAQKFAALFVFLILLFGTGYVSYNDTLPLREKSWRDATLVQAYEYGDRCGKYTECSAWKGRFLLEPEHIYVNKDLDGFDYHTYVDNGRKDKPMLVNVSATELGAKLPWWTPISFMLMVAAGFFLVVSTVVLIVELLFGDWDE